MAAAALPDGCCRSAISGKQASQHRLPAHMVSYTGFPASIAAPPPSPGPARRQAADRAGPHGAAGSGGRGHGSPERAAESLHRKETQKAASVDNWANADSARPLPEAHLGRFSPKPAPAAPAEGLSRRKRHHCGYKYKELRAGELFFNFLCQGQKRPFLRLEGRQGEEQELVLIPKSRKEGLPAGLSAMDETGPAIHIGLPFRQLQRPGGPQDVVAVARNQAYASIGRAARRGSAQAGRAQAADLPAALHNVHYQAIHKSGAEYAARPRGPRAATGASAQWPADFFHGPPATASPQDRRHFRTTVARTDCNSIIICATV